MGPCSLSITHRQKYFKSLLITLVCWMTPLQLVHARDETMPQNLQSWDIEMGMHASHSFDLTQSVYSHYSEDYEPVVMTLQDFKSVYRVLAGETLQSPLFSLAEPIIEPLHYNFEVDSNGGLRFDLRFHF